LQIVVIEEQIRIAVMMSLVMHDGCGLDTVGSLALGALAERTAVEQPMTEAAPARAAVERATKVAVAIEPACLLHALGVDGTAAPCGHRVRAGEDGAGRGIRGDAGVVSHW
jgi:hypothetical protein